MSKYKYEYATNLDSSVFRKWVLAEIIDSYDVEIFKKACEYDKSHNNNANHFDECYKEGFSDFSNDKNIKIFQKGCDKDSTNLAALCWLGRCYLAINNWGKPKVELAVECFKKVLDSSGKSSDAEVTKYALNYWYISRINNMMEEHSYDLNIVDFLTSWEDPHDFYNSLFDSNDDVDDPVEWTQESLDPDAQSIFIEPDKYNNYFGEYYYRGILNDLNMYYYGLFNKFYIGFDEGEIDEDFFSSIIKSAMVELTYIDKE